LKDAQFTVSLALPNTGANNNTASLNFNPELAGFLTNQWRLGYWAVAVPALADHTNTSVNNTLTLQDSADGTNFANTSPLVQIQVPGVASTGSAAATVKVPNTPGIRQYVRFNQNIPANGGNGNNAVVTYSLSV
jgi:hypothetical protein